MSKVEFYTESARFLISLIFRQDDTIEKAADYNFCKLILKEIFHIKMKKIVAKPPDYVR